MHIVDSLDNFLEEKSCVSLAKLSEIFADLVKNSFAAVFQDHEADALFDRARRLLDNTIGAVVEDFDDIGVFKATLDFDFADQRLSV
jgi:hypothetical protein